MVKSIFNGKMQFITLKLRHTVMIEIFLSNVSLTIKTHILTVKQN
jgi:hypothetical protein